MANPRADPANLQEYFSGLVASGSKSQSVGSPYEPSPAQSATNRPSHLFDLNGSTPQARKFSSEMMTPNNPSSKVGTPVPTMDQSGTDRTASLLNLLKFNQPSMSNHSSSPQSQKPAFNPRPSYGVPQLTSTPSAQTVHGRGISASDLLASLSPKPASSIPRESTTTSSVTPKTAENLGTAASANPQDYLLQLLNRPKPSPQSTSSLAFTKSDIPQVVGPPVQKEIQNPVLEDHANTSVQQGSTIQSGSFERRQSARKDSPIRIFGSGDDKETTPFEPKDMPTHEPTKDSIFTYVNPFEQLAASSPRNTKLKSGNATPLKENHVPSKLAGEGTNQNGHKRKSKEASPVPLHMSSRKRRTSGGSEILQSVEPPTPTPLEDGRTQLEALMGIGAPTNDTETVAEALNEVADRVSKQVETSLAEAELQQDKTKIKEEDVEDDVEATLDIVEEQLHEAAIEVKEELDKGEDEGLLESTMPKQVADAVRELVNEAANGDVNNHDKGESSKENTIMVKDDPIPVYNFPLKPFVSISLKQEALPTLALREEVIMDIARLKKEFDQIDRTLATASDDFIVYAMPKLGGLRVIRQDDGLDRTIFRDTRDRIFNVAISTATPSSSLHGTQTLIATAVSGTVYWATICQPSGDSLKDDNLEKHGLAFPPIPAIDENISGGQLKTRAKRSNRHPEFFAIGRGKSIQIVFPLHAKASNLVNSTYVVDTETYFQERSLKVNMGKAGKDFIFSEDDTTIATLDKAGRLRFWDVRDLINEMNATASKLAPIEINTPSLTFKTGIANEKAWPTSVLFVDKLRPYTKGTALRYVLIGMKQNHTLQLWDLGLGKAVQELSFPHEKESNAICSVSYHPASGIIVVGHPTRNSIYFIHLSAPKYNLPGMPQAKYVHRLANKDTTLPKPESTAIMSGMREYSFVAKGQLRSIDLLPVSSESTRGSDNVEDPALFELYVMHSKGVTCLSIKKEDLGWSQDSRVMHPVDGEEIGCIKIQDLHESQSVGFSEPSSVNGDITQTNSGPSSSTKKSKESIKTIAVTPNAPSEAKFTNPIAAADVPESTNTMSANGIPNGSATEKPEKRKKKKVATGHGESSSNIPLLASTFSDSHFSTFQQPRSPIKEQQPALTIPGALRPTATKPSSIDAPELLPSPMDTKAKRANADPQSVSVGILGEFLDKEIKNVEKSVSAAFSKVLGHELESLYRRMDNDKRAADAAEAGKQVAVLRLVSDCLTENVDKALARHINHAIKQEVLPVITEITSSTLNTRISETLTQQLHHEIPHQLKRTLPDAVNKSLQNTEVLRVISEQITNKITGCVQDEFLTILHGTITPKFQNLAINTAHNISAETERRVKEQLQVAEAQHREDSKKVEELTALVRGLSEMIHTMAAAQSEFQSEILKLQQRNFQERRPSSGQAKQTSALINNQDISPEQHELNTITALMSEGMYEEGTIKWLHSSQQANLFDHFFIQCDPVYLQQCQALVTLSVGAAVTASLDTNLSERLEWLEVVFSTIDPRDPDIRAVAPKIMNVLCQRLQSQYMRLAEHDPRNPLLRKIPPLTRKAEEIASMK